MTPSPKSKPVFSRKFKFGNAVRNDSARRSGLSLERLEDRTVPAFMLRISTDGGTTFGTPVVDNAVGDTNPNPAAITTSVSVPGGSVTLRTTSQNLNTPALGRLTLSLSGNTLGGDPAATYDLVVQSSVDGLVTGPAPQNLAYNFTGSILESAGTATMQTWVDNGNTLFQTVGTAGATGAKTLPTSPPLSVTGNVTLGGTVPYSATTQIRAAFTGQQSISLNSVNTVTASPNAPATVGDRVWLDLNADGVQDANEPGLAGVMVQLFNASGVQFGADQTTDANGNYLFTNVTPGTYSVKVTPPSGYTISAKDQTLPVPVPVIDEVDSDIDPTTGSTASFVLIAGQDDRTWDAGLYQLGSIEGLKTLDLTGNGFSLDDDALAGTVVYLDANNNGTRETGEVWTVTSVAGEFRFDGLRPGTYRVREEVPNGYEQTGGPAAYTVTLQSGTASSGNDFANFRPGTISGKKVTDRTGDGVSGDDTPLAGVTIKLYRDADNDGVFTAGDGGPIQTTQTLTDGTYAFTKLGAGRYFVSEEVPTGYVQTGDPLRYTYSVDVDPTQSAAPLYTGNDFSNFKKISISGTKRTDITGNGYTESDDTPLAGVTIALYRDADGDGQLTDIDGGPVATATTVADGTYAFTDLGPGRYFVSEFTPAGYVRTAGPDAYNVPAVSGTDVAGLDFGNFKTITISGKKYRDITGNGVSIDDTPLAGVVINLYADGNGDGQLTGAELTTPVASIATAADGTYQFSDLGPGKYLVSEVVQPGWTATFGGSGYTFTAISGVNVGGKDFYNKLTTSVISGYKYKDRTGNGYSADDTPLAGTVIYLDANGNGTKDTGEVSTITGADGSYSFTGLNAGTYVLREVVPSGYLRTGPTLSDAYTVILAAGASSVGNNFTNYQLICAPCTFSNVSYRITHADGTTATVTDLRGNTREGDVITATFTVNAPAGETRQVSFASYTAPDPYFDAGRASLQTIYDLATGAFASGTYTLTVHVPNSYYQVDFVCGFAIDRLGPAGSNIFYTPQQRLLSADNSGTHPVVVGAGTVSGYKYNDKNANGTWDAGEQALAGWVMYVDANGNGVKDASELATITDANGYYKISNLPAGSSRVREVAQAGWVQSAAPAAFNLSANQNLTGVNFGNYQGSTVSGYKFLDRDANGVWNTKGADGCAGTSDDETGLGGWTIYVDYDGDGQLDAGEPSAVTAANGSYTISGVKAGTYAIREVMQTNWVRTTGEVLATFASGQSATVSVDGKSVSRADFGNFKSTFVMRGDTATISFWQCANGQALIKSLNGGPSAMALGNWLAASFPNMYGSVAGANNLTGKTNTQVAAYFCSLYAKSGMRLEAQVLATALAVFVTDVDLAGGTYGARYGFTVNKLGAGSDLYNIGSNGAAFGVANNTVLTVFDILSRTNQRAVGGVFWSGNSSFRTMGNNVFTGINEQGDIY